jgi:hypothetical protein
MGNLELTAETSGIRLKLARDCVTVVLMYIRSSKYATEVKIQSAFHFNRAKIGGRASIVKLSNGNLFVISPTPIEEGTKVWVDSIGTVKYLVAPGISVRPLYSPSSDLE